MTYEEKMAVTNRIRNTGALLHLTPDMIKVLLYIYERRLDIPCFADIAYGSGFDDATLWPVLCMLSFHHYIAPFQEGDIVSRKFCITMKAMKLIEDREDDI